jgi:flagellar hook-length control protein FliK
MSTAPISSSPAAGLLAAASGGPTGGEDGSLFARLMESATGIRIGAAQQAAGKVLAAATARVRTPHLGTGLLSVQANAAADAVAGQAATSVADVSGALQEADASISDGEILPAIGTLPGEPDEDADDPTLAADGTQPPLADPAQSLPIEPIPVAPVDGVVPQSAPVDAAAAAREGADEAKIDAVAVPGAGRREPAVAPEPRRETADGAPISLPEDSSPVAKDSDTPTQAVNTEAVGGTPRESRHVREAAAPTPPAPVDRPAPADQVSVHIAKAAANDERRITIRLDPPELGRVEVTLDTHKDSIRVALAVDRPETLDLLRRDAQALDQALARANLRVEGGLEFSLRQQDQNPSGQSPQTPPQRSAPGGRAGDNAPAEISETRVRTALPGSGAMDIIV